MFIAKAFDPVEKKNHSFYVNRAIDVVSVFLLWQSVPQFSERRRMILVSVEKLDEILILANHRFPREES